MPIIELVTLSVKQIPPPSADLVESVNAEIADHNMDAVSDLLLENYGEHVGLILVGFIEDSAASNFRDVVEEINRYMLNTNTDITDEAQASMLCSCRRGNSH